MTVSKRDDNPSGNRAAPTEAKEAIVRQDLHERWLLNFAKKRIFVVDGDPLMRHGLKLWLKGTPDLEVCGEAESKEQGLTLISNTSPDIVVTGILLPDGNGLELVKDLHVLHPEIPVLVLSIQDESLYAGRALRAGARGYVMKRAGEGRIAESIREVLQGRISLSREMATHLLQEYSGNGRRSKRTDLPTLTDREFEIFQLIGEVRSNREIAERLQLSPKTVETHRINVMRKLNLGTGPELMRFALQYTGNGAQSSYRAAA